MGEQFWHHIEQLPWSDNRVDYQKINRPVITLDLLGCRYGPVCQFLGLSSLGQFTFLALATGTNKAVALIPFNDALQFPEQVINGTGDTAIFAANSPMSTLFDEFYCPGHGRPPRFGVTLRHMPSRKGPSNGRGGLFCLPIADLPCRPD